MATHDPLRQALAPAEQVQNNQGGGRSIWRPGRGFVKQIGQPPAKQVQWDAPHAAAPAANPTAYPFPTPATQPAPVTGGALNTPTPGNPIPSGAQGLTDQAGWEHLFPKQPSGQPRGISPPTPPVVAARSGAPNNQPQAPNAGGSITSQYGTASVHKAAPVAANWQQQIMSAHPNIGIAGTPENAAFIAAFNQHGAPERGMQTASEVMKNFPNPATPSPALAHDDTRGNAKLLPGMVDEARKVDPYALN